MQRTSIAPHRAMQLGRWGSRVAANVMQLQMRGWFSATTQRRHATVMLSDGAADGMHICTWIGEAVRGAKIVRILRLLQCLRGRRCGRGAEAWTRQHSCQIGGNAIVETIKVAAVVDARVIAVTVAVPIVAVRRGWRYCGWQCYCCCCWCDIDVDTRRHCVAIALIIQIIVNHFEWVYASIMRLSCRGEGHLRRV